MPKFRNKNCKEIKMLRVVTNRDCDQNADKDTVTQRRLTSKITFKFMDLILVR